MQEEFTAVALHQRIQHRLLVVFKILLQDCDQLIEVILSKGGAFRCWQGRQQRLICVEVPQAEPIQLEELGVLADEEHVGDRQLEFDRLNQILCLQLRHF